MTKSKTELGQIGENAAVEFLQAQGYRILERNFRNVFGEIDIIAAENDTVCFVEVKTRHGVEFGSPYESITPAKQRKIVQVARSYLQSRNLTDASARIDVIAVFLEAGRCRTVEILKGAFEAQN